MDFNETIKICRLENPEHWKGKVIGLVGDLGVGKTHFCQQLAKHWFPKNMQHITSPTFTYCNQYEFSTPIHHYDIYRIDKEDKEKLWEIGLMESMQDDQIITWIEWVNLFPFLLEDCDLILKIEVAKTQERVFSLFTT